MSDSKDIMQIITLDKPNSRNCAGDFFFVGNPDSDQVIFLLGSCRIIPYLNYLNQYNESVGNKYKIYCILPYAFHWTPSGQEVNYLENLTKLETNESLLKIFGSTKIFIHEHHANFGVFNTLEKHEKNIYQFGMKPEINLCLPNWNDNFVLVNDLLNFDEEVKIAYEEEIKSGYKKQGMTAMTGLLLSKALFGYDRFYKVCEQSDFPEFGSWFKNTFQRQRLFWNFNHITKYFSLKLFEMLAERLGFQLNDLFWEHASKHDHLEGNYTPVHPLDIEMFGYQWK